MWYSGSIVAWRSVNGADGYEVYYKVGKNGTYKKLASITKTSYSSGKGVTIR